MSTTQLANLAVFGLGIVGQVFVRVNVSLTTERLRVGMFIITASNNIPVTLSGLHTIYLQNDIKAAHAGFFNIVRERAFSGQLCSRYGSF